MTNTYDCSISYGCWICGAEPVVRVRELKPGAKGRRMAQSFVGSYYLCTETCIPKIEQLNAVELINRRRGKPVYIVIYKTAALLKRLHAQNEALRK